MIRYVIEKIVIKIDMEYFELLSKDKIRFKNGSQIKFTTYSRIKYSLMGASYNYIFLDDFYFQSFTSREYYKVMEYLSIYRNRTDFYIVD